MSIVAIKWNHNGSVLALVGTLIVDGDVKESNVLQLYSPFGEVSLVYYNNHHYNIIYCDINFNIIIFIF
jgi:hypothetical protein